MHSFSDPSQSMHTAVPKADPPAVQDPFERVEHESIVQTKPWQICWLVSEKRNMLTMVSACSLTHSFLTPQSAVVAPDLGLFYQYDYPQRSSFEEGSTGGRSQSCFGGKEGHRDPMGLQSTWPQSPPRTLTVTWQRHQCSRLSPHAWKHHDTGFSTRTRPCWLPLLSPWWQIWSRPLWMAHVHQWLIASVQKQVAAMHHSPQQRLTMVEPPHVARKHAHYPLENRTR